MSKNIVILSHTNNSDSLHISYVHDHACALAMLGNKVIVLAVNNWFPFFKKKRKQETIYDNGVEIRYINRLSFSNYLYNLNINGYLYYFKVKKEVKKILKEETIDLIDAHTFKIEGFAAYLLKKKFNIKTFITLHGTSFNRNFITEKGKKLIKKIGDKIDYYICVSEKIKRNLKSLNIKNTKLIYNGIDFYDFEKNNNNYNIITAAYFSRIKNIDLVIEGFSKITEKYKKANLTIVGDGSIRQELEDLTKQLKLENKVNFTGVLSKKEIFKLLSNSNIFILPSRPEGFGISYVEAMYCGCVAIGTKNEGIDGFIKDNINGFLIEPKVLDISKILDSILSNVDGYENIRKEAINDASKMSWNNNAKNYLLLLKEVDND